MEPNPIPSDTERRQLQARVLDTLSGTCVTHPALYKAIIINRKGVKHCISRRYPNTHLRTLALVDLPVILSKAVYLGKEADNHVPPRPGIFIHRFETRHELNGTVYLIWLYVRETPDLVNFYDLGVVDL